MADKILVPLYRSYGNPVEDIGEVTTDIDHFFTHPEEYKLVLFAGGEDLNPKLYGETSPKGLCSYNDHRDAVEQKIFEFALKHKIKMTGICRGMQLITALSGGRLIHHLDGHNFGAHGMRTTLDGRAYTINSLHHQMCVPPKDGHIIGWAPTKLSGVYYGNNDKQVAWPNPEVEALVIPRILGCGVQYHPEMMSETAAGRVWFIDMIKAFLAKDIKDFTMLYTGKSTIFKAGA